MKQLAATFSESCIESLTLRELVALRWEKMLEMKSYLACVSRVSRSFPSWMVVNLCPETAALKYVFKEQGWN